MPDVYHVYGADRRDRNVDCLDNAGENANSRLAIIGTFSREILGVHASITRARVSDDIRRAYVVFFSIHVYTYVVVFA